jgi:hypothetical protein
LSRGLKFLVSYTFAKSIDNGSGAGAGAGTNGVINPLCRLTRAAFSATSLTAVPIAVVPTSIDAPAGRKLALGSTKGEGRASVTE